MTHARPSTDPAKLRALAAQGRLWLCEIMAWLCDLFGHGRIGKAVRASVLRDLHYLRGGIAAILGLLALHRLPPPPPGFRRNRRPMNAPPGFRRGGECTPLRSVLRLLKCGRGLHGRIAALARVLDTLDAWVARMVRRLDGHVFVAAYVMVRAPVDAVAPLARRDVPVADSS